jgi:hypothetical protein
MRKALCEFNISFDAPGGRALPKLNSSVQARSRGHSHGDIMNRRTIFTLTGVVLLGCAIAGFPEIGFAPAVGQTVVRVGQAGSGTQNPASVPDLSGAWTKPYIGIESPASGPGPVTNRSRRNGRRDVYQYVGDYTNPILKPEAAAIVKKYGEISLTGVPYPSPRNQCWPEGVPEIFVDPAMQLLQQPDKITILYPYDHQVRRVRTNLTRHR